MNVRQDARPRGPARWATPLVAVVLTTWLAAVVVPPVALVIWRERRLADLAGPEAQASWDAFRDDMRRQTGPSGPVQRKVPKSPEPPELVWLRDYVHLAIIAWMTLGGVLGGFLAALAVGIARTASAAKDRPARARDDQKQDERDAQHTDER